MKFKTFYKTQDWMPAGKLHVVHDIPTTKIREQKQPKKEAEQKCAVTMA